MMKNREYSRRKYKKPELANYGGIKNITQGGNPESVSDDPELGGS